MRTKDHYLFAISQLEQLSEKCSGTSKEVLLNRIQALRLELESAPVSSKQSVFDSHEILCRYKNTNAKAAFNMDPGMMYLMGVAAESGELLNKAIRVIRHDGGIDKIRAAIETEAQDVYIYLQLVCMFFDIDLDKLVVEKSKVIVERALNGYYGPPIVKTNNE